MLHIKLPRNVQEMCKRGRGKLSLNKHSGWKTASALTLVTREAFIQGEDQRAASKNLPKITTAALAGGTRVPSRRTS